MESLAALMVIVACQPQDSTCLQEPVAVISYQTGEACYGALSSETKRARAMADLVYARCFPVDPSLVAGRNIRQSIDPAKLAVLDAPFARSGKAVVQALAPMRGPLPLERYQDIR